MSPPPTSPDQAINRLVADGYGITLEAGHLLVHDVPFATATRTVERGTLVCPLDQAGDVVLAPSNHVMHFAGGRPHDATGQALTKIEHQTTTQELIPGVTVERSFSSKPTDGGSQRRNYRDFHEKVTTYASILAGPAQSIDPQVSPLTFRDPHIVDSVHRYHDTASSRAEITALNAKLDDERIALIGLGGTNSYVLDLVAKTPVAEIHLFDGDEFSSHNAFRTPGAAPIEQLRSRPLKTAYLAAIYDQMHANIIEHPTAVTADSIDELTGLTFAFIAIDHGPSRRIIIDHLLANEIPFIDVGIGVHHDDHVIRGQIRTTLATTDNHDHIDHRIPCQDEGPDDDYATNIQLAELNALNATLAVIRWKQHRGIYAIDEPKPHHSVYVISGNEIINEGPAQ